MKDKITPTDKQLIEEWLAKGNKITICEPGATSKDAGKEFSRWKGKKKTKKEE
tara:strand:- start:82 stop:240 length:159 start_codon:yes stop_codon:yes gene_type:complete